MNNKVLIGIGIALLLLLGGSYLYLFHPQVIPGMASISPVLRDDVSILVLGLDNRDVVQQGKVEADSIILVKLQAKVRKLTFIGIPSALVVEEKALKDTALEDLSAKIEKINGIEPDYYFAVGYKGFIEVIDELDGIEVSLKERLRVPDLGLNLKKGSNVLSGQEALNYARWYDYRKDEVDRMQRQQQVIKAIVQKSLQAETLLDVPQMYGTITQTFNNIETNLDRNLLAEIIEFLKNKDNLEVDYEIIKRTEFKG